LAPWNLGKSLGVKAAKYTGVDFGFETTLSGKTYARYFRERRRFDKRLSNFLRFYKPMADSYEERGRRF